MAGFLSGLDKFGLGDFESVDVFEEEKKEERKEEERQKEALEKKDASSKRTEADYLFDKSYECPCCDKKFTSKTVRTGRVKLIGQDPDLRAKYQGVDPLKYDTVSCPNCGYSALTRFFTNITSPQLALIKDKICKNFKKQGELPETVTYEEAYETHKLVLINAIVKKCRASEKAFICLKTAWILRAMREELDPKADDYAAKCTEYQTQEKDFLKNAYDGFVTAVAKENFPMCGMDETTIDYLLAALAWETDNLEMASRLVSKVISSRVAKSNIKEKARDLKDHILEAKK